MAEVLNGSFKFVIAVEIGGPASGVEGLAELGLERVHNQSDFKPRVGGKHGAAVDPLELEGPLSDEHDLLIKVRQLDRGELLGEVVQGLLCEVGRHIEVAV